MKTISYEVSKKLKEFLGDSAPEPTSPDNYYSSSLTEALWDIPAYTLDDILSKPFCEAFETRGLQDCGVAAGHKRLYRDVPTATDLRDAIAKKYYNEGFLAIEEMLIKLM